MLTMIHSSVKDGEKRKIVHLGKNYKKIVKK